MSEKNPGIWRPSPLAVSVLAVCMAGAIWVSGCSTSSPEQQISKARHAYETRDYHAAEVYLKSVLREHQNNGAAWALLGRTSLARYRYDDAIHQFNKAQASDPPGGAVALPLARALLATGEYRKVLETLERHAGELSDDERAVAATLRGDALAGLNRFDEAAAAYQSALSIKPTFPEALQGVARLAMRRDDAPGAREALSRALSDHPDDAGTLFLLGEMDYQANQCEQVIRRLNHALEAGRHTLTPAQRVKAWIFLADCQLRSGQVEAAQKNIDAILAVNQSNPFGNYLQALMDIRQGRYREAANHVQAVLNVAPDSLRGLTLMSWILIAQGQPDKAQPFLSRVLDLAPDNTAGLRLQAGLWMAQNRDEQARDLLEQAYRRDPDQSELRQALTGVMSMLEQRRVETGQGDAADDVSLQVSLQLGLANSLAQMDSAVAAQSVLSRIQPANDAERLAVDAMRVHIALASGDTQGAIQSAEALAKKNPDDAGAQMILARSYVVAGRRAAAADVLQAAHEIDPDNAAIVRAQAELAARRGNYSQAIDHLAPLQRAHPDDTGLTLALARLYARADRGSEAIRLLQAAVNRQPASDDLNQALARVYLANGQTDRALSIIHDQLDKESGNVAVWLHLQGVAQLLNGQSDAGLKALTQAADKAPDQPGLRLDVAKAALLYGKVDAATEQLDVLRQKFPDFSPAAGLLALVQAHSGNVDAALDQVADLRNAGKAFDADVLEGDVLKVAGRFKQAEKAYASAYRRRPGARLAMAMFGMRQAGQMDNPAEPLEQWLHRSPDDAAVALQLANWYQQNKRLDPAAELYRNILTDHPDSVVALNNLAVIEAERDPQQALSYARKAYEKAPASAAVADTLGWLMVNQGQLDAGIELLAKADEKAGAANADIRFHLGAALAKRGRASDKEQARALLNEAVSSGLQDDEATRARAILERLAGQ